MTDQKGQETPKFPKEIAKALGNYQGIETESNAKKFFETASGKMVIMSRKLPKGSTDSNYKKHCAAVLAAFEKRRDGHKGFKGKWLAYLNHESQVWQSDYDKVWSDYTKGKLI